MASTEISIKQLPTANSIEDGNFIIIQTENSTNKLDFKDFVVGLENTTFQNTIETNTTSIESLSSTLYGSTPDPEAGQSTHLIPITIGGVNYAIMLSAIA
jgi:hypothetical protein|tara:strand:- start:805 stop:1104 length:300 start_codon:yes stop_codon:yes gene_type:complete